MPITQEPQISERFEKVSRSCTGLFGRAEQGHPNLKKLMKIAQTYDEWEKIHDLSLFNKEIESFALQKMFDTASTFVQVKRVCVLADKGSDLRARALQHMARRANNYNTDELIAVFLEAPLNSQECRYASLKLSEQNERLAQESAKITLVMKNKIHDAEYE